MRRGGEVAGVRGVEARGGEKPDEPRGVLTPEVGSAQPNQGGFPPHARELNPRLGFVNSLGLPHKFPRSDPRSPQARPVNSPSPTREIPKPGP